MAKTQKRQKRGKTSRPQLDLFGDAAPTAKVKPGPAAKPPSAKRPAPPVAKPTLSPSRTAGPKASRVTAESLAQKQREISVSEFFVKNRHLLGFDNPSKALLTTIKEAVDNSLDACEEAGVLPELTIEVQDLALEAGSGELTKGEGRFLVVVQDNGPGIVKQQVPKIFGKLLYGSKFHRLKQSLTGDQDVLIERAGRLERLPIGRLVDDLLEEGEEVRDVSRLGIRAPAFDRTSWRYEWRPVSHLIRHRRENEILEVRTERGKRVRVTGCHSLFAYAAATRKVREVEARSLREGDYIVAPRRLPDPRPVRSLNLLSEVRTEDLAGRQLFVHGVPEAVFEALADARDVVHGSQCRREGFLPAHLVKRLGLEEACAGASLRTRDRGRETETPVTWPLDRDLMRLLGLYVARGFSQTRQAAFTFSSGETALVEEVVAAARGLGLSTTVETRPRNAVRVSVLGGLASVLFTVWCGSEARTKKVPAFVFHAGPALRRHFLDGLYLGGGHPAKRREVSNLGSASRELIDGVETLWLLQGVVPSRLGPIRRPGPGREPSRAWSLDVYGFDIAASYAYGRRDVLECANRYRLSPALSPAVGGHLATPKVKLLHRDVAAAPSLAASDLCLLRVEEVVRVEDEHAFVYDLSVPGCENFVAGEGAVACHNSRGQQGIGISAAAMYGQLTTGKPIRVTSRVGRRKAAHVFDIRLDTRKNEPVVTHDETLEEWDQDHGTRVELEIVANWQQGQRFVNRYVEHTALANPHATIHYSRPVSAALRSGAGRPGNETLTFPRATEELPKEAVEIKPHPHGVELGALMLAASESKSHDVRGFLQTTFSRVSAQAAGEILSRVPWGKKTVRPRALGANRAMAEALHKAIGATRLMNPPTTCLSPIGDELMRKGLVSFLNVIESEGETADENVQLDLDTATVRPTKRAAKSARAGRAKAEPTPSPVPDAPAEEGVERIKGHSYFIATVTRPPRVYRGNPFQVEVGLAYGGSWPAEKTIELFRFANRVPLLFQRGACGITEAIARTDWRNYLLSQPKGSLPVGPMALLVHVASVWVPFTSESKEAVAHYPDILKEIQLAAQECGRKLATFIRKKKAADYQAQRRSIFELYIEEVAIAIGKITGRKPNPIKREFLKVAHKVTAAEMQEEEKALREEAEEARQKARAGDETEEED